MDMMIHALLILAAISQGLALYGVGRALWQIRESNERMEKIADRNEKMVMEILKKVYDVRTPHA